MKNHNKSKPESFFLTIVSIIVGMWAFIYVTSQILKFIQSWK